ncbi:HD-GYP domain, c-di-GMP phosphodiesterase class II (or its inactivated variant) [Nannocystis exedens]|uniref:HD-GYP domain, c-di-GMP phosphodiesterase class II (Or its inactivated variant) n=1 Tax=Nannocystis exedens TaxID=54 RepID=A0A1I1SWU3_9BACT|nr:HD family phosphohydrolase [Nannocystis exedens]PCC66938.1 Cyclic di-GMP phosphodiesterase response regulator RpfG [Nannocystis exedens]SFD50832.1 HD-GYP domain, c-di-GMP phosphodiesterase class II (or its inactivated variant) [Nannocystis exedens]
MDEGLLRYPDVLAYLRQLARDPAFGRVQYVTELGGTLRAAVIGRGRARLAIVEALGFVPPEFDVVLVVGPERSLAAALGRMPVHRAHALALPTSTGRLRRAIDEALLAVEAILQSRVADQLVEVGLALNRERDPRRVLELIVRHARAITGADAGSIYVVEDDGATVRFRVAHNDSVAADLRDHTLPVSDASVVGACVLSGQIINLEDMYSETGRTALGRTFVHDRSFDERFGYQTRSLLTVPMRAPEGQVIGAVQLINAKDGRHPLAWPADFGRRTRPFSAADERVCLALATQGAVALENANLYAEVQALFEGFVRASVTAIEQRDPTTSGHSQRVADLTVALAKAVDRSDGPLAAVKFSADDLREIEVAGLLHDFGKVGVREHVLVKAKKLFDWELTLVEERLDHLRTAARLRLAERELIAVRDGTIDVEAARRAFTAELLQIERWREVVRRANEPALLPEAVEAEIHEVAAARSHTPDKVLRILDDAHLTALRVARGSLTDSERSEVQNHVRHTFEFLRQIPWGQRLRRVPEIAGMHHEYLDGSGYPRGAAAAAIPIQARMMTVADIFDALTAADRPYKKAVPVQMALDILHAEACAGKLDPVVLEVFVGARVYDRLDLSGGRK